MDVNSQVTNSSHVSSGPGGVTDIITTTSNANKTTTTSNTNETTTTTTKLDNEIQYTSSRPNSHYSSCVSHNQFHMLQVNDNFSHFNNNNINNANVAPWSQHSQHMVIGTTDGCTITHAANKKNYYTNAH